MTAENRNFKEVIQEEIIPAIRGNEPSYLAYTFTAAPNEVGQTPHTLKIYFAEKYRSVRIYEGNVIPGKSIWKLEIEVNLDNEGNLESLGSARTTKELAGFLWQATYKSNSSGEKPEIATLSDLHLGINIDGDRHFFRVDHNQILGAQRILGEESFPEEIDWQETAWKLLEASRKAAISADIA